LDREGALERVQE